MIITVTDNGGETMKTKGYQLLLDAFQFVGSVDVIEFQTTDPYSSLDLTNQPTK
jgi:hypothetical protein